MKLIPIFESGSEKMTLKEIMGGVPDSNELIWEYIGSDDLDTPLPVKTGLVKTYCTREFISNYKDTATKEQQAIVDRYRRNINDTKNLPIVVSGDDMVIDGFHKLMAMYLEKIKDVKFVDIIDL